MKKVHWLESFFLLVQELLESLNTLKVEEGDTNSLQIVEKEEAAHTLPSPLLQHSEDEGRSAEASTPLLQRDDAAAAAATPYVHADMLGYGANTDVHVCPPAFASGYTTMEMFQQAMPQGAPASPPADKARYPEMADLMVGNTRLDHIRRFSGTSITDDMFTIMWAPDRTGVNQTKFLQQAAVVTRPRINLLYFPSKQSPNTAVSLKNRTYKRQKSTSGSCKAVCPSCPQPSTYWMNYGDGAITKIMAKSSFSRHIIWLTIGKQLQPH